MLIQTIKMLWDPGTGAPSQIDYMIAEGFVYKDGEIVSTLEYTGVHMVEVDSLMVWEFEEPIEADLVTVNIYDVDYPHTIDISGVQFPVPAADVEWQQLAFELPVEGGDVPPPEEPETPTSIVSSIFPALIVLPVMAGMAKVMKS